MELEENEDEATVAANREVEKVKPLRGKRARYHHYYHYDEHVLTLPSIHVNLGNKAAADKFTKELGFLVTESTVRNMKKSYLSILRKEKDPERICSLPHRARRRPLMLRDYDQDTSRYIKSLREKGGIVNHTIVIATSKSILFHKNPGLLKEHGGPICLSSTWAESFLRRIGYVKRKATKAARKLPDDFPEVKQAFLQRVKSEVET